MDKKLKIVIGLVFVLSVVAGFRVWQAQQASQLQVIDVPAVATPPIPVAEDLVVTEVFAGQVDGVSVKFEHSDYLEYRLITGVEVQTGTLNTERGFGDDPDATVYVLNWDAPESEQRRYVRTTAEPGQVSALTPAGIIDTAHVLLLQ